MTSYLKRAAKSDLKTLCVVRDLLRKKDILLVRLRWVYTESVFHTFFVRTENAFAFFTYVYMQTVYTHPFFCRPDESASANFTNALSRAWL